MNPEVFITCAVTGDDTKVAKSPHCPITPRQIEPGIKALQLLIDCLPYAPKNVTQYAYSENVDGFSTGKIAQMIFWSTIAGPVFDKERSLVAWDFLKARLKELGLSETGGVQRTKANCLRLCRGGPVAVYGRGSKGAGLALLLRQWTDDLVVLTDGDHGLGLAELAQLRRRGIAVEEARVERLEGNDGQLRAVHFAGGGLIRREALFFNTGQHQRSPLPARLGCDLAADRGVICDSEGRTSVPGVYVAGDVSRDVQLAIVAASEGARAALAINKDLLERDHAL